MLFSPCLLPLALSPYLLTNPHTYLPLYLSVRPSICESFYLIGVDISLTLSRISIQSQLLPIYTHSLCTLYTIVLSHTSTAICCTTHAHT